jgi:hypothetical protein
MLVPFEPEQKLVREIVELHAGGQIAPEDRRDLGRTRS